MGSMPGVKRSRDDSDNEEADQDTDSEHSSEEDFAASDGSESDESSELDEQECDERRHIYATDVGDLERQFALLREQLYKERLSQVDRRLNSVRNGEDDEYLGPLDALKEAYTVRLEVAAVLRQLKLESLRTLHEAETQAAMQNYEEEKVLVKHSIREQLEERIRKLQEDRQTVAFTSNLWAEQNLRRSPRSQQKEGGDRRRRKPVTVEGPFVVYRLREEQIMEDWTTIRRAVQAVRQQRKNKFRKIASPRPISQTFVS